MNYYGAKDMAVSFRTVRKNTLIIAEEIPEDKYSYRPADGTRSVAEILVHLALGGSLAKQINLVEKRFSLEGFDYMKFMESAKAEASKPRTKVEIIALLTDEGEKFAQALDSLSDEFLGEIVVMPPGGTPPSRTRFDMLGSVKEHEMHHRGQLMLIERMLGITPHLTRQQEARIAAMRAAAAVTATQNA